MTNEEILLLKNLTEKSNAEEKEYIRLMLIKALEEKILSLKNNNLSMHDISIFLMAGYTEVVIKLFILNDKNKN
jgi:hypothetical protein